LAAAPHTLQGAQRVLLDASFTPAMLGVSTATLTAEADDKKGPHTVLLTGKGVTRGAIFTHDGDTCGSTVAGDSVSFGRVTQGHPVERTITITSTGTAPITVLSAKIESGNLAFKLDPANFRPTIPPGQSATLHISFDPQVLGAVRDVLVLPTDSFHVGMKRIALCAVGSVALLCIRPPSVDFGVVPSGTSSSTPVSLDSCGDLPLTLSDVSIAHDQSHNSAPGFAVTSPALTTIAPGQAATVVASYTASSAPFQVFGYVQIASNAPELTDWIPLEANSGRFPDASVSMDSSVGPDGGALDCTNTANCFRRDCFRNPACATTDPGGCDPGQISDPTTRSCRACKTSDCATLPGLCCQTTVCAAAPLCSAFACQPVDPNLCPNGKVSNCHYQDLDLDDAFGDCDFADPCCPCLAKVGCPGGLCPSGNYLNGAGTCVACTALNCDLPPCKGLNGCATGCPGGQYFDGLECRACGGVPAVTVPACFTDAGP
jgi:hypothetical protein